MAIPRPAAPRGRLEDVPLARVLAWAREERATGCVTIRAQGGVNRLYLSEGRPAGTVLSAGYRPLPQLLLELGWLDELALDRALEEVYGGVPLEQALVKTGALQEERLREALELQEGRNLEALGALTAGEVEFKSEPLPASAKVLLSPERALLDALALPSGRARAGELVASLDGLAARLNSAFQNALPALRLRDDERGAVALLREGLGVAEFVREAGLPEPRAQALLAVLVELELVSAVDLAAEEETRRAKLAAEQQAAAEALARSERTTLEAERSRGAQRAWELLGEHEDELGAQEIWYEELRAERVEWRQQAALTDAQATPIEPASTWLAAHDASQQELDRAISEEAARIAEVEARGAEVDAERRQRESEAREEAARLEGLRRAEEQAAREKAAAEEAERVRAEDERARAEEAERVRVEEERARAEEQARLAAEAEARARAEEDARLAAEAEARARAEEEARLAAEAEARARAEAEENARLEAERQAQLAAEEEERRRADIAALEARARQIRADREARARAEAEEKARLEAEAQAAREAEEQAAREAEERARLEAQAQAAREAEEKAAREAEERARLEAEAQAAREAEEKARLEAEEKARAARPVSPPGTAFEPISEYESDRRAMLAARQRVEASLVGQRAEIALRKEREAGKEHPSPPKPAEPAAAPKPEEAAARPPSASPRPRTLSPEEAQREIQRRFEEQARQWLIEEQSQEAATADDAPSSLEASFEAAQELQTGLTSDLESLLSNSLHSPVRRPTSPGLAARPSSTGAQARPTSANPQGLRPASTGAARPTSANPQGLRPASTGAARPTSAGGTRPPGKGGTDKFEFTFDSFQAASSKVESADVDSLWDDAGGDDMALDDEARARRARLRRMGMQNTGLLPGGARPDPEPARPEPAPQPAPATAKPARPSTAEVAAAAAVTATGPEVQKLAKEIEQRYAKLRSDDHFTRLGVPRNAGPAQVKAAFVELAKRFHPDKLPSELAHLADKTREVFTGIRESYDLLQNDKARAEYVSSLSRPPTPMAASAAASGGPRQVSGEAQLEAKKLRTLAEIALKKKAFMDAEGHFKKAYAIENHPNDLAGQAWAIYLDPARKSEAGVVERLLKQALAQDPGADRANYVAGVIARAASDLHKAEMHFRAALKTNPNHPDAGLELRVLERRKGKGGEPPPTGKKGFFSR